VMGLVGLPSAGPLPNWSACTCFAQPIAPRLRCDSEVHLWLRVQM
jgi:hypothetical protein